MEKAVPIETLIGVFKNYRDGIILRQIIWKNSEILFLCNITDNSIIDNPKSEKKYHFEIVFTGVISLFHSEYDTYEAIANGFPKSVSNESIFEEIENSDYIKKLPVRKDWGNVKHYCLSTYDAVFNIIAKSYTFKLIE